MLTQKMTIIKSGYADLFTFIDGKQKRIRAGTSAYAYYWQQLEELGVCTHEIAPNIFTIVNGTYNVEKKGL